MTQAAQPKNLPTILASLRQDGRNGELILEQNDGLRRLYLIGGELVYLQSDVAGEQFGNYLLRQGVLDFPVLNKLLANDERFRLGEKVVQWGLMSVQERDSHLQLLQEQVMVNALEHQIVQLTWNPGPVGVKLSEDLQLKLDHRHFIWTTFLEAHLRQESFDLLQAQGAWRWEGIPGLLEAVSDLPLDPATAYALSFLGSEPISFQTFHSLSELPEATAARITLSLWAVGALTLVQGEQPSLALGPEPMAPAAPSTPPPMPSFPRRRRRPCRCSSRHRCRPRRPHRSWNWAWMFRRYPRNPSSWKPNRRWKGSWPRRRPPTLSPLWRPRTDPGACTGRPRTSNCRNAPERPSAAWNSRCSWIPRPTPPSRSGCCWAG